MGAQKKPTHEVVHGKLYSGRSGVMMHVPKGTQYTLTEKQALKFGGKVKPIGDVDVIDATPEEGGEQKAK